MYTRFKQLAVPDRTVEVRPALMNINLTLAEITGTMTGQGVQLLSVYASFRFLVERCIAGKHLSIGSNLIVVGYYKNS